MVNFKLGKSEMALIKSYCSRVTDDNLSLLASSLPQSVIGDRAAACEILQKDKEIDKWLSYASSAGDWFSKIDSIGDFAAQEQEARSKKTSTGVET